VGRRLSHLLIVLASVFAAPSFAATERTGDMVDGTPVIDRLDTRDLAAGQLHRFWFRVSDTSIGQGWYVPVLVMKGGKDGPRLLLTAGIHGDEMNGISVIHRLAASVDPSTLAGTLVAGRVNTIATDPTREPGDMVVRIVWWSKDPKCKDGC
jgi:uncharacterized protein